MRLFVGVPLAARVIDQLETIPMRLRSNGDNLRWSTPEAWHITLQFLGNASRQQFECIVMRLRGIGSSPVRVQLGAMDFFRRAGIFFVGVELTPELLALRQNVTAATGRCGFMPETRPYHPHITLSRAKAKSGTKDIDKLKTRIHGQPNFINFLAEEFILYESFTAPTGSRYEVRERFRLGK